MNFQSISPGYVNTGVLEASGFLKLPQFKEFLDSAPALQPEDIADATLYVLGTPPHVQVLLFIPVIS